VIVQVCGPVVGGGGFSGDGGALHGHARRGGSPLPTVHAEYVTLIAPPLSLGKIYTRSGLSIGIQDFVWRDLQL
jgi:hypothetical protein